MAIKQADSPQEPRHDTLFPRWIRICAFVLTLIFLVGAAIFWIWNMLGSDLNTVMAGIFTALGAIFGFIALLPFFFHTSHDGETLAHTTSPAQVINNYFGSFPNASPQPEQFSTNPATDNEKSRKQNPASEGKPQNQELASGGAQTIHEPPPLSPPLVQRNEPHSINRNDLLDKLSNCPLPIFDKVVFYLEIPAEILPGEGVAQTQRATALIRQAEFYGHSLQEINEFYERATGKKNPI